MGADGRSFDEMIGRLDEIVEAVKRKDTTLERSLDLLDEAIEVGLGAVELVDTSAFSDVERARVEALAGEAAPDGDLADGA